MATRRGKNDGCGPVSLLVLITIKEPIEALINLCVMTWMKIETAPFDRDLEVAVIEANGDTYAVIFPCHRVLSGWTKAATGGHVEIYPTHWRNWEKG